MNKSHWFVLRRKQGRKEILEKISKGELMNYCTTCKHNLILDKEFNMVCLECIWKPQDLLKDNYKKIERSDLYKLSDFNFIENPFRDDIKKGDWCTVNGATFVYGGEDIGWIKMD